MNLMMKVVRADEDDDHRWQSFKSMCRRPVCTTFVKKITEKALLTFCETNGTPAVFLHRCYNFELAGEQCPPPEIEEKRTKQ